ncbi:hypothetical protein CLV51_10847 [Chitinophaga niastensis]|uniref:Uncharacterized protein n=1 Tax=Chitinophaga niastensis TaxID=536980 RepID=A0A2P8HAV2_CHINA|nr:hypothetical protein CLV51_10847 [Chitinophaga niastensis]
MLIISILETNTLPIFIFWYIINSVHIADKVKLGHFLY